MNLTEIQGRIMSKVHVLRENDKFGTLPSDTRKYIESMRFGKLEDMNQIDLYVLESYIDKTENSLTSRTVYDLISEIKAFVDGKLLDESDDQERVKLEELKTYLEELNEAIRDWEVREMKREAEEEKPVELDFIKIVDSLSSIVDRLIVQYGGNVNEQGYEDEDEDEEEMEEAGSCPRDLDDEMEEQYMGIRDKLKDIKIEDMDLEELKNKNEAASSG